MPYVDRSKEKSIVKGMLLDITRSGGALIIYFDEDQLGTTVTLAERYTISTGSIEGGTTNYITEKVSQYTIRGTPCTAAVFRRLSSTAEHEEKMTGYSYSVSSYSYCVSSPEWASGIDISIRTGEVTEEDWRFNTPSTTVDGQYRVVEDRLVRRSQPSTDLDTVSRPQPPRGQLPPDRRLRP